MKKIILFFTFGAILSFMNFQTLSAQTKPRKSKAPLIPVEDFFRNAEIRSFSISPDGNHLAFQKPWEKRMNIFVKQVNGEKEVRVTSATERDIQGYFWKNNNTIVFIQDKGGDENFHLFSVKIDGSNLRELTPFDGVLAQIIDPLEDIEEEMIIGLNKRNPQIFDPYRININTGKMTLIMENPGNITGWDTDNVGQLRIAMTTDGINTAVLYRKSEKDPFEPLVSTTFKESFSPLYFDFNNKNLYVSSNLGRDKAAIIEFDPDNKKEVKLLFEHDEVDVSGLMRSKKRKVLTGVSYTTWKRQYHFFDKERESMQRNLEKQLPGYEVALAGTNKDEDKGLVVTYSDKALPTYYYYDIKQNKLTKLASMSPWLKEEDMCEMKPIKYTARDGLVIHGYLTLPLGVDAKNLPVVVNPHGGPWARDNWGFNPEVQFLANRGYAVMQMNFRGSVGYGREFWEKSFKQWGQSMQDDITDGVNWLIKQGIADPKRVAIYGASYGGYATLAGITLTPELYACAVDYVGVSNLFTFMNTIPPYWKPYLEMMYEMVGDPEKDKEMMHKASPVFHVDKIKVPLFIAQGANDPRVVKAESDQMVEALKAKGIDVPYMVKDNEGHGFQNEENRMEFYREMEKFFDKHL
ncbi:MAG: S9 family peptidase [Flavobacteriales bacterium]